MSLIWPIRPGRRRPSSPIEEAMSSRTAAKMAKRSAEELRTGFGTSKLRNMLRERCRIRIRQIPQSFRDMSTIEEIVKEEWRELRDELLEIHREMDIFLQEVVYKDLVQNWTNEDMLEEEEQYEIHLINMVENNELLCPVCQKKFLKWKYGSGLQRLYICACKASFSFVGDKQRLRSVLDEKIDLHEQKCVSRLSFFVEQQRYFKKKKHNNTPSGNILNAMCGQCGYLRAII